MVTKHLDDFIKDRDETFWAIELSNGETIYEDDSRPGELSSAWVRLKKYVESQRVYITKVYLCFRKRKLEVFRDLDLSTIDGLFFSKSILGKFIYNEGQRPSIYYYLFGIVYKDEGVVRCEKWRVPELIKETETTRELEKCLNESKVPVVGSHDFEMIKEANVIWR